MRGRASWRFPCRRQGNLQRQTADAYAPEITIRRQLPQAGLYGAEAVGLPAQVRLIAHLHGARFRVYGLWFMVWGLGFRV